MTFMAFSIYLFSREIAKPVRYIFKHKLCVGKCYQEITSKYRLQYDKCICLRELSLREMYYPTEMEKEIINLFNNVNVIMQNNKLCLIYNM